MKKKKRQGELALFTQPTINRQIGKEQAFHELRTQYCVCAGPKVVTRLHALDSAPGIVNEVEGRAHVHVINLKRRLPQVSPPLVTLPWPKKVTSEGSTREK